MMCCTEWFLSLFFLIVLIYSVVVNIKDSGGVGIWPPGGALSINHVTKPIIYSIFFFFNGTSEETTWESEEPLKPRRKPGAVWMYHPMWSEDYFLCFMSLFCSRLCASLVVFFKIFVSFFSYKKKKKKAQRVKAACAGGSQRSKSESCFFFGFYRLRLSNGRSRHLSVNVQCCVMMLMLLHRNLKFSLSLKTDWLIDSVIDWSISLEPFGLNSTVSVAI